MVDNLDYKLDIINSYFPDIIYGGCGIFAYTLSDIFTKRGIYNSILYVLETETPIGAFRCDIKFTHFFVCIRMFNDICYIDSSGICSYSQVIERYNNAPLYKINNDKLYEMLLEKRLWNNKFSFQNWNKLSNLMYKII